jgi:hypothetical protein
MRLEMGSGMSIDEREQADYQGETKGSGVFSRQLKGN